MFRRQNHVFWIGFVFWNPWDWDYSHLTGLEAQTDHRSNQFHLPTSGQQILPWGQNFVAAIWNLAVQECFCTYRRGTPARRAKILIRARDDLLQKTKNVQAKLSTGKLAVRPCRGFRATPKASTSPKSFFKGFTFYGLSVFGRFATLGSEIFWGQRLFT